MKTARSAKLGEELKRDAVKKRANELVIPCLVANLAGRCKLRHQEPGVLSAPTRMCVAANAGKFDMAYAAVRSKLDVWLGFLPPKRCHTFTIGDLNSRQPEQASAVQCHPGDIHDVLV